MTPNGEQELFQAILSPELVDNPLEFVLFAFPWGKMGTPLEKQRGPRTWQKKVLLALHGHILAMREHDAAGAEESLRVFKKALSSGRGIGKSALVAWLTFWFMSTRIGGTVVISANTESQLRTVTWGELGKWHTMLINRHWFELSATTIRPAKWFDERVQKDLSRGTKYYYVDAKLWSEENPDAYAGVHNTLGLMLIFDEASGIPAPIWTVAEGYFTEPILDRFWFAFSNPRKNNGAFFECFHKDRDNWNPENVDSRTVEGTDKEVYQKIVEKYGEDSDEARVEVYGEFPSVGDNQFISLGVVEAALNRPLYNDPTAPVIIGVDVARFGSDKTVIWVRKGRDRVEVRKFSGLDTMQVVGRVIEAIGEFDPDLTIIDEGGLGAGVLDRLLEQRYKVRGVNFGSKADDIAWGNKRSEMWGLMKEWLKGASLGSGNLSDDRNLTDDLTGPQYKINSVGSIMLEAKDAMKKRGIASPDEADALAITFAFPVARKTADSFKGLVKGFTINTGKFLGSPNHSGWMN